MRRERIFLNALYLCAAVLMFLIGVVLFPATRDDWGVMLSGGFIVAGCFFVSLIPGDFP